MSKKKGGSQSSADVVKLVSPATFAKMDKEFSDAFSANGGRTGRNGRTRKTKKGGSQASADVVKLVSPATFAKMDAEFTDAFSANGGRTGRGKAKKGGSQASADVVKLVSPATFARMDAEFTDAFTATGGTRKALIDVDINDTTGPKMMVYNKTGGKKKAPAGAKKPVAAKPKPKVKPAKAKAKAKPHKGGDGTTTATTSATTSATTTTATCPTASTSSSWFSFSPPQVSTTLPPAHLATYESGQHPHSESCAVPSTQQLLASQNIDTMSPFVKTTVMPATDIYQGTPFAFGGAKKRDARKPKRKAAPAKKKQ